MSTSNPLNDIPSQPQTPGKIRPSARVHWRTYFYDHPKLTLDRNKSTSGGKPKVYCKECFESHMIQLKCQDAKDVNTGARAEVRDHNVLVTILWDAKKPRDTNGVIGWIRGETTTILNHLRYCQEQPKPVRDAADTEHRNRKNRGPQMGPPAIALTQAGPFNPPSLQVVDNQRLHYLQVPITNELSLYLGSTSSGSSVKGDSRSNSPYPESLQQTSSRSSSVQPYSINRDPLVEWSTDRQNTFNMRLGRLTALAGLPMSWIENPEFILFCQEFIHPAASIPGRKALSRRILPAIKRDFQKRAQAAIKKGALATIQGDGWSAINDHHLNAFMMTVERKIHTLRVHDSSGESKTAEKLLVLLESVITEAETKWQVKVVAVCTDASGESRKARKLLKIKFPYLVTPDCYAHQINLVVGDFFKSHSSLLVTSTLADELITWLRSKSQILALLRGKCRELGLGAASILRAVITRWTAHYLAYRRLLDLHRALQSLVIEDECRPPTGSVFVKGPAASKTKAKTMVKIISDNTFWGHLAAIKQHLEPLAIAANVTQSTFCRVDEVLLTFGALTLEYTKLRAREDGDQVACDAILYSLEKRWSNTDQDVFIAAVVLNPYFKHTPFNPISRFQPTFIYKSFVQLWERFFPEELPPRAALYQNILDYMTETGAFSTLRQTVEASIFMFTDKNQSPDPCMLYNSFEVPGQPPDQAIPLIRLARHIFSICANSASCERLFSAFGNILTRSRNRMGKETLQTLAEIKMHVRDEHLEHKDMKNRLKRRFETVDMQEVPQHAGTSTQAIPIHPNETPDAAPLPQGPSDAPSDQEPTTNEVESQQPALLKTIVEQFVRQGVLDHAEPDHPIGDPQEKITLEDLFNFSRDDWLPHHQRAGKRSLNDEMEVYELLDADFPGEEGVEVTIDEMAGDILTLDA